MPRGGARLGAGRPRKPKPTLPPPERLATPRAKKRRVVRTVTLEGAIAQAKDLTQRLLGELDTVTTHADELEDLICDETAADRDSRRRNAMLRAIGLGARAATLKVLIASTRTWADLERPGRKPRGTPGKKAQAAAAAQTAGQGTEWGSDLDPAPANASAVN